MVIGARVSGHVDVHNRGDAEVMDSFGIQDTNAGLMVLDFAKRMQIAQLRMNTFTQKRQEHPLTYKSGGRGAPRRRCDRK